MFKEIIRAFFSVIGSPFLLFPTILAVLANLLAVVLLQDPLLEFFTRISNGELSGVLFAGSNPVFLLSTFSSELFWIFLLVFATLLTNSWIGLLLAHFAGLEQGKKMRAANATLFAIAKIPVLVVWSVLVTLLAISWLVILFAVAAIGEWNPWIGLILLLFWLFGSVLGMLVLAFIIPALGIENCSMKEAFKKSRILLQKNFGSAFLFVLVVGLVVTLLSWLGTTLSDAIDNETLALVVAGLFVLLQSVVANLSLPFFYLEKKSMQ